MCVMLCPASCLPLLRELAQWRCLLGWHRQHSVGSSGSPGLSANAGHQQQGSEAKGKASRPIGHTKPLSSSQVSPGLNRAPLGEELAGEFLKTSRSKLCFRASVTRAGIIYLSARNSYRCKSNVAALLAACSCTSSQTFAA